MENSFQTSFIPKKPVNATNGRINRPPTSLFTVIAFLLLVIMGVASGGLFLYKNYLINQKEVLSTSLGKVRNSFEKDTIDELELYDKRVSASKQILGNHIVFSPMFALLGTLTLPQVQYTQFSQDTAAGAFSVKMSGIAEDYKAIALQADVFNTAKGRSFKNVVFSNLTKDKNNRVAFNIEFTVDPELLSYERNMALEQAQTKTESSAGVFVPQASVTPAPIVPDDSSASSDIPVSDNNPSQ